MMPYKHVTHAEREVIAQMRFAGRTLQEIGDELGRDKGTISRELRRNRTPSGKLVFYSPQSGNNQVRLHPLMP